jgi:hypothetical protein
MRLAKHHTPERLEAACFRALRSGAHSYRSVKSILGHGLDRVPLEEQAELTLPADHENVRGAAYYQLLNLTRHIRCCCIIHWNVCTNCGSAAWPRRWKSNSTHSRGTEDLAFEDRLGLLVERELTWRDDRRLQRLLQEARLRVDCLHRGRELPGRSGTADRSCLMRLGSCEWIRQSQVVLVIVGPTGVGKTYLACALGQAACRTRPVGALLPPGPAARRPGARPR